MAIFEMDLEGLPKFQAKLKDFPIDGEKRMGRIATRMAKKFQARIRSRGFQSANPGSIKVGTGAQYGHTIDAIKGHGGAINWGMYIRAGISKDVPSYYKIIFHELGTKDRFRGGRGRQTARGYVWRPHKTNKTDKKGYTGALRARHMIDFEGRMIIAGANQFVAEIEKELAAACKD